MVVLIASRAESIGAGLGEAYTALAVVLLLSMAVTPAIPEMGRTHARPTAIQGSGPTPGTTAPRPVAAEVRAGDEP